VVLAPVPVAQHTGDPIRDALVAAKDLTLRLVAELAASADPVGDRAETLKTLSAAMRAFAELERRPADGKKGARAEAAQEAAIGKFATPQAPPRLQ